jgi:hypothetical protein
VQRILPSAIVAVALRAAGVAAPTAHDVVQGFRCYHLALLTGGVFLWLAIGHSLRLGRAARWMGFIALYGNFAIARMTYYYAPLTDTTAWFCGLLCCWLWLERRWPALACAGLVGAFAWPILPLLCTCLMLDLGLSDRHTAPQVPQRRTWWAWWHLLPAIGFAVYVTYRYVVRKSDLPFHAEAVWPDTFPLAVGLTALYLTIGLGVLLRHDRPWHFLSLRSGLAYRLALIVAMFAVVHAVARLAAAPVPPSSGLKSFLELTCLTGIAKPGVFLVAHAVYFGPIVLLGIANWPTVADAARQMPPRGVLGLSLTLTLGVTSESRHLIAFAPLFVTVVVAALERQRAWKWPLVVAFTLASILGSKCWLPPPYGPFSGAFAEFPDQYYFMNQGPWMSAWSYAVQGAAALVVGVLLVMAQRRSVGRAMLKAEISPRSLEAGARTSAAGHDLSPCGQAA